MKIKRLHDLSHTLIPGQEEYRLDLDTRQVDEWEQFKKYPRMVEEWYVISEVCLNTHTGTHIELPYHHFKDGLDAARFPLENLIGEGTVVDLSVFGNNERISLVHLQEAAGDAIHPGDIVYFYTGLDRYYHTPRQHDRPWFAPECIDWLINKACIKIMGVDTSGHEVRNPDGSPAVGQPNHTSLLGAGLPLIEYLAHLDGLLGKRFFTCILPLKLVGAEACPVRVIAIEWDGRE